MNNQQYNNNNNNNINYNNNNNYNINNNKPNNNHQNFNYQLNNNINYNNNYQNNNMNYQQNYNINYNNNVNNTQQNMELCNRMIEDYKKLYPGYNFGYNHIQNMLHDYNLMEDILEEIDRWDPKKSLSHECQSQWHMFSSEKQLEFIIMYINQFIYKYYEKHKIEIDNNETFKTIYTKFLANNFCAEKNLYYIKKYNLSNVSNLNLQIVNSVLFYTYFRLLIESRIIKNVLNLNQNLTNDPSPEIARMVLNNKSLNSKIDDLKNKKIKFIEQYLKLIGEKIDNITSSFLTTFFCMQVINN